MQREHRPDRDLRETGTPARRDEARLDIHRCQKNIALSAPIQPRRISVENGMQMSNVPLAWPRRRTGHGGTWIKIQRAKDLKSENKKLWVNKAKQGLDEKVEKWLNENAIDKVNQKGNGEVVGDYDNVFHQTHVGGKGNSVWWQIKNGQMWVLGEATHGKTNSDYKFSNKADGMPKNYTRKKK
ncbi:hypothetical protein [Acaryochloris sp. IP29b_bin.137]|uniref:hypothetical protein n=1 Tax=Acaryochloris sp. IP29b_bin.137 TaxID=2969217 RepID=UPI0026304950|nr:hypothetical protein [Acaryochloris sp. IP29b_bin.137]